MGSWALHAYISLTYNFFKLWLYFCWSRPTFSRAL